MEKTVLGRSGLKVSVIGLGFWQAGSRLWGFRGEGVYSAVKEGIERALGLGVNFFDTAEVYGGGLSEKLLGQAVRELNVVGEVVVASKVAGYRVSRRDIVKAAERIARRLGFIPGLIQYHWPPPLYHNLCRVVRGLEDVVDKGLAEYIGVSNFPENLLRRALECARRHEIVSNQVQYSLGYRVVENGLKQFMEKERIALIAWSPLAKGALADRRDLPSVAHRDPVYQRVIRDERLQEILGKLARKYNATKAQIALAWLVAKSAIPIPGFRNPKRVEENAKAAMIRLVESDIRELDEASKEYKFVDHGRYNSVQSMRYVPALLQKLIIALMGGI